MEGIGGILVVARLPIICLRVCILFHLSSVEHSQSVTATVSPWLEPFSGERIDHLNHLSRSFFISVVPSSLADLRRLSCFRIRLRFYLNGLKPKWTERCISQSIWIYLYLYLYLDISIYEYIHTHIYLSIYIYLYMYTVLETLVSNKAAMCLASAVKRIWHI